MGFDLGRVFERAGRAFVRGLSHYFLIWFLSGCVALLLIIPIFIALVFLLIGLGVSETSSEAAIWGTIFGSLPALILFVGSIFGFFVIGILQNATMLEMTNQLFQGYEVNLSVAFQWARYHFWRYLGVSLLVGFGVLFGLILIIPGIIFLTWWILAQYIVARENLGILAAIGRSRALVNRAFGGSFLGLLILMIAGWSLVAVSSIVSLADSSSGVLAMILVSFLGSLLIQFFWFSFWGALYEELVLLETQPPHDLPAPGSEVAVSEENSAAPESPSTPTSPLSKKRSGRTRSSDSTQPSVE